MTNFVLLLKIGEYLYYQSRFSHKNKFFTDRQFSTNFTIFITISKLFTLNN